MPQLIDYLKEDSLLKEVLAGLPEEQRNMISFMYKNKAMTSALRDDELVSTCFTLLKTTLT